MRGFNQNRFEDGKSFRWIVFRLGFVFIAAILLYPMCLSGELQLKGS
jgi:hypothetical protein